jgi:ribonucleoside-diphosphate reductase alpha chain
MIKIGASAKIKEISNKEKNKLNEKNKDKQRAAQTVSSTIRPEVVDAKVYKLKSAFVKNSVFITLSYVDDKPGVRPIEIFINSKDLTRAPEYVVLTRLVSAIFRRSNDPMFILEELQGIFDPNGGTFKEGKYYHSFYAEIADVIERFFFDVGILERPDLRPMEDNGIPESFALARDEGNAGNSAFRICKECNNRTLKTENGCDICMSPECGYSKCGK